jgi:hypothetical protein
MLHPLKVFIGRDPFGNVNLDGNSILVAVIRPAVVSSFATTRHSVGILIHAMYLII